MRCDTLINHVITTRQISQERRENSMELNIYSPGSLVQVTSYSPFRGLKGTIRTVDTISDDLEEPFCFYQITLEGTQVKEPIWFEYDEIELVTSPLVALEA
jgi:hypothetical protein